MLNRLYSIMFYVDQDRDMNMHGHIKHIIDILLVQANFWGFLYFLEDFGAFFSNALKCSDKVMKFVSMNNVI